MRRDGKSADLIGARCESLSLPSPCEGKGDERDRPQCGKQGARGVAAVEILEATKCDLKISGTATGETTSVVDEGIRGKLLIKKKSSFTSITLIRHGLRRATFPSRGKANRHSRS